MYVFLTFKQMIYMKRQLLCSLLIIALTIINFAPLSYAAPPAGHTVRHYEVMWNGLHIGDLIADIKEVNGIYHFNTLMRSRDIIKLLAPYRNTASGVIAKDAAKELRPVSFRNTVKLRRKSRDITMQFDAQGVLKTTTVVPPDMPNRRPPVNSVLLQGSIDPLTATLLVGEYVKKGRTQFITNVYDGRKLFAVNYQVRGKTTTMLNGKSVPTIHISFSRKAIAGFTEKELKNMPKENPVFDVYLADDGTMLPVKAIGKASIGSASATFKRSCATVEECSKY